MLWSKSKKLNNLSRIHSFFISGDTIKIKVNGNNSLLSITHADDFGKHFPDVDLSLPSHTSEINICLCCVLNYLVIMLNYTDFFVLSFGDLVFFFFFRFWWKMCNINVKVGNAQYQVSRIFPEN